MADHAQLGLYAHVSRAGGAVTITLVGEIDYSSLNVARQALHDAGNDAISIVFDLSGVTFCDCAGIGFLAMAASQFRAAGGEMTVRSPSRRVRRVLELTGTLACLCPDEQAAL